MNDTKQAATLPATDPTNARDLEPQKERVETYTLAAVHGAEIETPVEARWYMARRSDGDSPIYCSVWLHSADGKRHLSGYGSARGYGYCKLSAAFDAALDSAGVKLARRVDGVGMRAVEEAMAAIAVALGYTGIMRRV